MPQPRPPNATALVWFKRDLRQDDHAPLAAAQNFESAMGLYIIEPQWLDSPEFSAAHLQFALESLQFLQNQKRIGCFDLYQHYHLKVFVSNYQNQHFDL